MILVFANPEVYLNWDAECCPSDHIMDCTPMVSLTPSDDKSCQLTLRTIPFLLPKTRGSLESLRNETVLGVKFGDLFL